MKCYICNPETDTDLGLTKSVLRKIKEATLCQEHKTIVNYYTENPELWLKKVDHTISLSKKYREE